jgi:hypothetical protein
MPTNTNDDDKPDDPVPTKKSTGGLKFPLVAANEVGNWISFARKKYQKVDQFTDATLVEAENSRLISLPLPMNVDKNYSTTWEADDLGVWRNYLRDEGGKVLSIVEKGYQNGTLLSSGLDALVELGADALSDGGLNIAQMYGKDMFFQSDFFKKTGAFSGQARNPYTAMTFKSPAFRRFSFQWKLVAKSYKEAVSIRDIVKEFQIGMSPSFKTVFENDVYAYPDLFVLEFQDSSFLYKFKPCVLTSTDISYHPDGAPHYIGGPNNEKIPASLLLKLDFQEMVILTRKDFEDDNY